MSLTHIKVIYTNTSLLPTSFMRDKVAYMLGELDGSRLAGTLAGCANP